MDIKYLEVLSTKSVFGVIWSVLYNGKPAVAKLVVLESGAHLKDDVLVNPSKQPIINFKIPPTPFKIDKYYKRRPDSEQNFYKECKNLKILSDMKIAPKFKAYKIESIPINDNDFMNIGIIIMERVSCDLSEISIKRCFTHEEVKQIRSTIQKFRRKFVHRDLKFANIGVKLDNNNNIKKVVILDCDKVINVSKLNSDASSSLKLKDKGIFMRSYRKTRGTGCRCNLKQLERIFV